MTDEVVATVHEWHAAEGWGRVTVVGSGDDVWTHYSAIEGRAFASLRVGEQVRLWYQRGPQPDEFQAVRVIPLLDYDPGSVAAQPPGDAYGSRLQITYDPD